MNKRIKTVYAVCTLVESAEATTPQGVKTIELKGADGMLGAMPVFTNKARAEKYAKGKEIIAFDVKKEMKNDQVQLPPMPQSKV